MPTHLISALPIMAVLAFEALLVCFPIILFTSAFRADNAVILWSIALGSDLMVGLPWFWLLALGIGALIVFVGATDVINFMDGINGEDRARDGVADLLWSATGDFAGDGVLGAEYCVGALDLSGSGGYFAFLGLPAVHEEVLPSARRVFGFAQEIECHARLRPALKYYEQ